MASNLAPTSRVKTRSPVNQVSKLQPSAPMRLKTVVRRLPPNLPEAVFWQTVDPWVSEESVSWKVFYQGKQRKKLNKENIPSRAYILFKNEETLASFSRGYDGHIFRDKQGNESQAVVEFALNQKVPPEKKKVDSRHATIQQDEDYLSFVAALQNPQPKAVEVDIDALLAATQPPEEPKTTPLLNALREQKSSALEKKLAASEAAKAHSRKAAAASGQKPDGEDVVQPAPKRSRKGRGTHHSGASASSTAPIPPNNPSAKQSKPSGAGRNRPAATAANPPAGPSTSGSSTTTPQINKEAPGQSVDEASQRRNRPILGLQSRHLKAALNGAGVTMSPTSQSGPAPISGPSSASVTENAGRPPGGPPRVATGSGGGGEKQNGKDGTARHGRGGGKERGRSRHPPSVTVPPPLGLGRGADATPRILSRQDSSATASSLGDASARDRTTTVSAQETGAGRGRGRRGRG